MKPINFTPPNHKWFIYVAPYQRISLVDLMDKPPTIAFATENGPITARITDVLVYPLNHLSEYHCRMAYGFSKRDMQLHIKKQWPQLPPESNVSFYLCEKIETQ